MCENPERPEVKEAEHLAVASKMADEICERFNPEHQNETMLRIRQVISQNRQLRIEKAKKELEYLNMTFENL